MFSSTQLNNDAHQLQMEATPEEKIKFLLTRFSAY